MKYKYCITSEMKKWWDKQNFGPKFQEKLQQSLQEEEELRVSTTVKLLYGKYKLVRYTGISSRPTFIWEPIVRGNATLYVFRAAYKHDDYVKEVSVPMESGWIEKHQISSAEREEIEGIFSSMSSEDTPAPKELPTLSISEYGFISNPLHINHDLFEETIYETEGWVNYIKSDKDFSDYYTTAQKIEDDIFDHLTDGDGWRIIEVKDKYIFIYQDGQNWILSDIKKTYDKEEFDILLERDKPTIFRRGYPYSFLEDKDGWRDMELEKKSNMVLSEEQVAIVSGEIQYPLFITGRAGSGKSTALQYLFAEIILRYSQHKTSQDEDGIILPPVYLSYSENLIADAKSLTSILLKKNSKYTEAIKNLGLCEEDVLYDFDSMFYVFQSLVRQCIQVNDKDYLKDNFLPSKHISFAAFNSMWNKKFSNSKDAAKKYGPSDSWHVIRTYIKGWNSDHYLLPQEYQKIPRADKTVSEEMYNTIYEKVWETWYSKLGVDGYWDDQDLVRYCIDNDFAGEQYSAVFCDESQDFTRVELDFIMKISSFSNRKIESAQDIKKLPFVFAGDEFQTLNPTGFSWRSLRGYFAEHICELVGLGDQSSSIGLDDPIELSENFRSTRQVVKLANRIQLLRASRFNEESKPQSPHFPQDGSPIVCLPPNDDMVFEELRKKGVILIVPAADGESVQDYIEKSPLNGKIQFEDGASVGITILNPTQAKGLEYPNVAIYGFDCAEAYQDLSLDSLMSWYDNKKGSPKDVNGDIDLKYHLSNAYVAVTRAGTKLFIIDNFNESSFWGFAFNHSDPTKEARVQNLEQKMLDSLSPTKQKLWDRSLLGWINVGSAEDITAENIAYLDDEVNRNSLENRAESLMDVGLMRQAASRHKEAGRKTDENRCRAKAYMFEDNYIKAAEYFSEAEMHVECIDNYWHAINESIPGRPDVHIEDILTKIVRLSDKVRGNKKVDFCLLINTKPSVRKFVNSLDDLHTFLCENDSELSYRSAWEHVINLVIPNLKFSNDDTNALKVFLNVRDKFSTLRINLNLEKLAELSFGWEQYETAIDFWDSLEKAQPPIEYYKAKVKILQYPKYIEFIELAKEDDWENVVLSAYRKKPDTELTDMQKMVLCRAIRNCGSAAEFVQFLPVMLNSADKLSVANSIINDIDRFGLTSLNKDALKAAMAAKHTDLSSWTTPKTQYADYKVRELFDMITFLKNIRNYDYINTKLGSSSPSKELSNFCKDTMRIFAQSDLGPVIYIEVGKMIERRNNFVECKNYYQSIKNMYSHPTFKNEVGIRAYLALRRLLDMKDDPKAASEMDSLRKELNIGTDINIPSNPSVSSWDWEQMIKFAISTSNELISPEEKHPLTNIGNESESNIQNVPLSNILDTQTQITTNPEHPQQANQSQSVTISGTKQIVRYGDYEISFAPRKNEVIIRYEKGDDDYQVKIKNGTVRNNEDITVVGNRLHIIEKDLDTPFILNLSEDKQVIEVFENNNPTGLSFCFECGKK